MTEDDRIVAELARIARAAGAILMGHFGRLGAGQVDFKGRRDLLTVADKASEKYVVSEVRRLFPGHAILAEESSDETAPAAAEAADTCWIIDPLDGTTNFVHSLPMFAVSIGVVRRGRPFAGCIFAPRLDELFLAADGRGATLNGSPIRVSETEDLIDAVLATGFAYRVESLVSNNLDNFARLVPRTRAVRRCGSAALDLAYTACGRFDGFWELHLSAWDVAAGAVIVREAGGVVTDLLGGEDWLFGGNVVGGGAKLSERVRAELSPFSPETRS